MATNVIAFSSAGINATVATGDKLVIRSRSSSGEYQPSLSVFPAAGGTAKVDFTHTALETILANPDDPAIKWMPWALGDIAAGSTSNEDTFAARIKALRITAVGAAVQVQGSVY